MTAPNPFAQALGSITDVRDRSKNNQNATISNLAGGYRNPASYCRYPIGDVSYSEELNSRLAVFGDTDGASAGSAHTHALTTPNANTPMWTLPQNVAHGGYITASLTTVWDTVGMNLFKLAGTLNNVYIEVFRENEAGGLSRLFLSADLSASITTSTKYVEATLNPPIITQAGERYMVRVRNSSTVATTIAAQGVQQPTSMVLDGRRASGADALKTTYTAAEAAALVDGVLPFALLAAKNLPVTPRTFTDDFNRPTLGGAWFRNSSTSNLIEIVNQQRVAYTGTTDGAQNGLCIHPAATDTFLVEADFYETNASAAAIVGLFHCCNRDFTQVVYLAVNNNTAKIFSTGDIEKASVGIAGGDGHWSLPYDPTTNTFTALKDGLDVGLSWVDTGHIISHDRDHRYGGVRISRVSGVNGGEIDNFTIRDTSAS